MKNKQNNSSHANSNYTCMAYNRLFLDTRFKRGVASLNQTNKSIEKSRSKQSKSKNIEKEGSNKKEGRSRGDKSSVVNQFKLNKSNESSLDNSAQKKDLRKNVVDTITHRKLQLSEKQSKKPKKFLQSFNISIDQSKLFEQRPHYSQNLHHKNNSIQNTQNGSKNRKLYTFCGQNSKQLSKTYQEGANSTKETEEEMDKFINDDFSPATIMVKEQELRRFTHKFAREKIEFEETLQSLLSQLNELKTINNGLIVEKSDCLQKIQYQLMSIQQLKEENELLNEKLRICMLNEKENISRFQQIFREKTMKIQNLQEALAQKQKKVSQIVEELQKRQRQLQKIQYQNIHKKMILPATNINHLCSINSQSFAQSPIKISKQIAIEIEFLRQQCANYEGQQMQLNKSLAYFKIENQHLSRELDLQKQTSVSLREEINELKTKIKFQQDNPTPPSPYKQFETSRCLASKQNLQIFQMQIADLLSQNAALCHSKQILQRSLQVSSQMILHLKQQTNQLRRKYEKQLSRRIDNQKPQEMITIDQVKTIVRSMMKQQLQLEDRLKKMMGQQDYKPTIQNENLKRCYQEGYQSIKQNQKKRKLHFKTQKDSGASDFKSNYKKNYTETSFFQQSNSEVCAFNLYNNNQKSSSGFSRTFR